VREPNCESGPSLSKLQFRSLGHADGCHIDYQWIDSDLILKNKLMLMSLVTSRHNLTLLYCSVGHPDHSNLDRQKHHVLDLLFRL
jgi:hypothetical protein